MINTNSLNKIRQRVCQIVLVITLLFTFSLAWQSNGLNSQQIANAATLEIYPQLIADLGTEGLKNQVEGRAKQDIGKTQSALDKAGENVEKTLDRMTNKADAVGKQVKGRAIQDIGKTQDSLQDVGNQIEDATDNALDAVKNFFGN